LSTINWILNNSCSDVNYSGNIPHLTDEELIYCLKHEKRVSGLRKLQSEARKRGLLQKESKSKAKRAVPAREQAIKENRSTNLTLF